MASLALGMSLPAFAADMSPSSRTATSPGMSGGSSSYAMPMSGIDWSRRYELTPLEMKRLRAKGLTDKEIYIVANAAMLTGRDVDFFVEAMYRGTTVQQIGEQYGLTTAALQKTDPTWTTPQWEEAVKAGRWSMPATSMPATSMPATGMPSNR